MLCREHGQQLTSLAAEYNNKEVEDNKKQPLSVWGVVKETAVDDVGLTEFYTDSFKYPLYQDMKLGIYEAMGKRAIALKTWNPFTLYRGYVDMKKRLDDKKLDGNLKGDGLIQGGVLVLDSKGQIVYQYDEEIGNEFEVDDLRIAINDAMNMKKEIKSEL